MLYDVLLLRVGPPQRKRSISSTFCRYTLLGSEDLTFNLFNKISEQGTPLFFGGGLKNCQFLRLSSLWSYRSISLHENVWRSTFTENKLFLSFSISFHVYDHVFGSTMSTAEFMYRPVVFVSWIAIVWRPCCWAEAHGQVCCFQELVLWANICLTAVAGCTPAFSSKRVIEWLL